MAINEKQQLMNDNINMYYWKPILMILMCVCGNGNDHIVCMCVCNIVWHYCVMTAVMTAK